MSETVEYPLLRMEEHADRKQSTPLDVAVKNPNSLRAAINSMCFQCIYDRNDHGGGSWRKQVESCTAPKCALYALRPITSGGDRLLVGSDALKASQEGQLDRYDENTHTAR